MLDMLLQPRKVNIADAELPSYADEKALDPVPLENVAPALLFESYSLLAIATLLVALRLYVRLRITINEWGWDDLFIILSWVFLVVGAVLVHLEVNLGVGQHQIYLNDAVRRAFGILKYNSFHQVNNVVCTLLTKISISFFILRIKNTAALRWTLGVAMALMTLTTIACVAIMLRACDPLAKLWTPSLPGTCLSLQDVYTVAHVQSGFAIVTDLLLTISPIVITWNMQTAWWRKFRIWVLMSLGLVATASNAARNAAQTGLVNYDFTWRIVPLTAVGILELSSGIIAACIPACMPFITARKKKQEAAVIQPYTSTSRRDWVSSRGSKDTALVQIMPSRSHV